MAQQVAISISSLIIIRKPLSLAITPKAKSKVSSEEYDGTLSKAVIRACHEADQTIP